MAVATLLRNNPVVQLIEIMHPFVAELTPLLMSFLSGRNVLRLAVGHVYRAWVYYWRHLGYRVDSPAAADLAYLTPYVSALLHKSDDKRLHTVPDSLLTGRW